MTTPERAVFGRDARSVFSAASLVVRRRARRDILLLIAWTALVAFVVVLSVSAPRQLTDTIDRGARQAVADAGSSADILIRVPVGLPDKNSAPLVGAASFVDFVRGLQPKLPAGIRHVSASTTAAVLGTPLSVTNPTGASALASTRVQLGMLTTANSKGIIVKSGRLPRSNWTAPAVSPIEIALSVADARAAGLHVGSIVNVQTTDGRTTVDGKPLIGLKVVGILKRGASGTANWLDTPSVWTPDEPPTVAAVPALGITVLTSAAGVTRGFSTYGEKFTGYIRVHLNPARFSGDIEPRVANELTALTVNSERLQDDSGAIVTVSSHFGDALAAYPSQARAALAQMSLVLASLLGVAIAVLILISHLLVVRRGRELALERARGASLASIATRLLLESLVVTVIAGVIGVGIAEAIEPEPVDNYGALMTALVVAVLAAPVQGTLLVRGQWSGRRTPANRQERLELQKRARARRGVVELTMVVLAVAALLSLASRGLLEAATAGIDLFLAAAPLLFGIVVTLVILRLYRWPVRAIGAIGRGSRGVLGVLGAARAEGAISALPLLALTLAVSLAVGGSLLISTVNGGQVAASWQRVGADARVDALVTPDTISSISHRAGVTAVGAAHVSAGVQVLFGTTTEFPTLFAIDRGFAGLVSHLPGESEQENYATSLRKLAAATPATARLPVVVDAQLAKQLVTNDLAMYYGPTKVDMHVIGVTNVEPSGYVQGPFIYVDLESLAQRLQGPTPASPILTTPNTVLITGSGAAIAATHLGVPKADIHSRASWLSARRHLALVAGTQQTMLLATIAVAVLAMIALVATALAGARDRGRSLSLLRTLGMRAGLGWWLALAELLPVVVAALVGGIVAGVGMLALFERSLGLGVLAGGVSDPPTVISPGLIIGLVAAAIVLLAVAILAEVAAHRRDQLSEVLRLGETV
ncbi:MAG TPA: FtsX-like permease family protein [Galbitalea sp.]